ncbi:D-alanyl-D-alanine carboxypeptidase family protein [Streptomyces sp. 4N509B]|uniref:D-alanyl-D-alanine carboxypeptidase family protein n=1 Tax=Streptomyces sp. 4N509B TaxID=3457413 RepID=UPI003FD0192F
MKSDISRRRFGATLLGSTSLVAAAPVLAPSAQAATPAATPTGTRARPTVSAQGAYLYDVTAGERLYVKNGTTARQMASTTKIMTAVVVLSQTGVDLDRRNITMREAYRTYVAQEGASTADLQTGDKLSVRQLLYGMMLPSGCDAAMALADHFGSGRTIAARTTSFIGMMNRKARSLGLNSTHYDSFDGISRNGDNVTTPRDHAMLAAEAMSMKPLRVIMKKESTVQTATNGRTYTWYNTNQLLGSYDGAVGIKTGTGSVAGPCLVFSAMRDGRTIVGVLLNSASSDQRYTDAVKLLDYAYGTSTASRMVLRTLPRGAQRD